MTKEDIKYQAYIQILKEELIPAMGCTEPIALAYAAAKAREVLGCIPERVHIGASGSIIKNVKSVIVPNTNHLKGIPAAATAGIIAGDASKELEVISDVTEAQTKEMASISKKLRLPSSILITAVSSTSSLKYLPERILLKSVLPTIIQTL